LQGGAVCCSDVNWYVNWYCCYQPHLMDTRCEFGVGCVTEREKEKERVCKRASECLRARARAQDRERERKREKNLNVGVGSAEMSTGSRT